MPDSIVKSYYEALGEGRLLAKKCLKCGAYAFPPVPTCNACGGTALENVEISGHGTLMYAAHGMAPPPNPRFAEIAPVTWGHIMLEEGIPVQALIENVKAEPEAIQRLFEKGPVPVEFVPKVVKGLPVLAFQVIGGVP